MLCRVSNRLCVTPPSVFAHQPALMAATLQGKRAIAKPRPIKTENPDWSLKADQWRFTGAGHHIKSICKQRSVFRDFIDPFTPVYELRVSYGDKAVICGESITPSEVLEEPTLRFLGEPNTLYTVLMTDIDYPSNFKPKDREFLLWAKANVSFEGTSPKGGDVLCEYVAPCPPQHTGSHRVAVLIAKQNNGPINTTTTTPTTENTTTENATTNTEQEAKPGLFVSRSTSVGRPKFSTSKFCAAHDLAPQSIVFFQTSFDKTVNHVYRQMGQEPPAFINPKTAHMVPLPAFPYGSRYKNQQF